MGEVQFAHTGQLQDSGKFSDCNLVVNNGEEFRVNKAILSIQFGV